jgi:lysyl-tRNA synthetase class 2
MPQWKEKLIDEILELNAKKLYQPTFITDYQKKCHHCVRDNPELTERFELMVCGKK